MFHPFPYDEWMLSLSIIMKSPRVEFEINDVKAFFSLAWNSILKTPLFCTVVVICIDSYEVNEPAMSSLRLSSDVKQRKKICECSYEKQFVCIFHDHSQNEWECNCLRTTLVCLTFGQETSKLKPWTLAFDDASRRCWLLSIHFRNECWKWMWFEID